MATVDQFRQRQHVGEGYVVNRDSTRDTIHTWSCRCIKEIDFRTKVTDGGFSDGYVSVTGCGIAMEAWPKLHACGTCRPAISTRAP